MRLLLVLAAVMVAACTGDTDDAAIVQEQGEVVTMMKIESPAFGEGKKIPAKFTCEGIDVNPELRISGVPSNAKSLVLIMDDPDAPPKVWEHWTMINIPPSTAVIAEGSVPEGAQQLMNDFKRVEWGGPCPPPGKVHNYNFKLYALDAELSLPPSARKSDVAKAMQGHVIEQAVLIGTYQR